LQHILTPVAVELAGTELEITKFADKLDIVIVRTDGVPEGSRRIKTLSSTAAFAAIGNADTFVPVLAILFYYVVIVKAALEEITSSAPVAETVTLYETLAVSTAELTVRVVWVVLPTLAPA